MRKVLLTVRQTVLQLPKLQSTHCFLPGNIADSQDPYGEGGASKAILNILEKRSFKNFSRNNSLTLIIDGSYIHGLCRIFSSCT